MLTLFSKKTKQDRNSYWLVVVDNTGTLTDYWSYRLSRRQGLFGAGQAKYWRMPRFFHRISARRIFRSGSWPIALFVHLSSSVSYIVDHTSPRFCCSCPSAVVDISLRCFFQAALPSLYPCGLDGKPQLSPTGGYELKVFFNGAHRRVSALTAGMIA
jgi:hypothetical protein